VKISCRAGRDSFLRRINETTHALYISAVKLPLCRLGCFQNRSYLIVALFAQQ